MNHAYRLVWNARLAVWVATSEISRGRGKSSGTVKRAAMAASLLLAFNAMALDPGAVPTGGQVSAGQASIQTSGSAVTIGQSSAKAAIDWQSFNIGSGASVTFNQPGAASIALNRVLGQDASQIMGRLSSNGQVFLLNPNGVLFGSTAQVNVGGLVASTLGLSNDDFMAGNYRFAGNSTASVVNQGKLTAADGGYVALLAAQASNEGLIQARLGNVSLAAGSDVTLNLNNGSLLGLTVNQGAVGALAQNSQLIQAEGGQVLMTAKAADQLVSAVVNNSGVIEARGVQAQDGVIRLLGDSDAGIVSQSGSLSAGRVEASARSVLQAGQIEASTVDLSASYALVQTQDARIRAEGGNIRLDGGQNTYLSGTVDASGGAHQASGGSITVAGQSVTLSAATVDASAASADGTAGAIRIGGGAHGLDADIANARAVSVSGATSLTAQGKQGKIVVWSDDTTHYFGKAQAGEQGFIEVSSKGTLNLGGSTEVGAGGHILYDPTNIVIDAAAPASFYLDLADPTPTAGDAHGTTATQLSGGNIVVTSTTDNFGASRAGAVYLYDRNTGALISALYGSTANDQVGSTGVTALSNGNYVVRSNNWANGAAATAGAVTWGSGSAGVSGVVSAANSLVGSTAGDQVGSNGITLLSNGNYLVRSQNWDNGAATNAGAVTWGSGSAGVRGVVSAANSLVGSTAGDQVGGTGIVELSNGNYVVRSSAWDNGAATNAGAVTWGSGSAGVSGVVSAANSLVGGTANDNVGSNGITALSNGNYVVRSSNWANGAATAAGAVTWGDGMTGVRGVVSAANSLVGSKANDLVGNGGITLLSNGNYVVGSFAWDNGTAVNAGAATWGDGTTGVRGVVSDVNSLVGSTTDDNVGNNNTVTALSNGNYVVRSSNWANGAAIPQAGAVTWGSGTTGVRGIISDANSLVGSTAGDRVGNGGITLLSNGNYVVSSSNWANGPATQAGAVTWGSGTAGVSGVVSAANSLVGSAVNDRVGIGGVTALSNGNYVVSSYNWANGAATQAGAVTWGDGTTGVRDIVSAANSLVGSTANDNVGASVTALTNGNYVVRSSNWDNGAATNAGAVTWGSGTTGVRDIVSAANSLVGSTANDNVGSSGITALSNGNYVVGSTNWDNGGVINVGAVTWGDGMTGVRGIVSDGNSLVGSTANDTVGSSGVIALSNGNYVVSSGNWDNGAAANAGAVTWGSGTAGVNGVVSVANSLVGSTTSDQVGIGGITLLSNGNYVVNSFTWDNGAATNAGAVTWGSGTAGVSGVISAANSLVGSTALDSVGSSGITALSNGNYVVRSALWDNGAATNAGAVTWGSGSVGVSGVVSAANSLVGSTANDQVGNSGITELSNGNYVVRSQNWDNGAATDAGAVTWGSGTAGVSGVVSAANSLVGSTANDQVGGAPVTALSNGDYLVRSPSFNNGAGAVWLVSDPSNAASAINGSGGTANVNPATLAQAAGAGSTVTLQATNNITVNSAVNVAGKLNLLAGNTMTLNAGGTITSTATGDAIVLSSKTFVNNAGNNALTASNGRWLVYTDAPAGNTLGGLASGNTDVWSASYAGNAPATIASGNRYVFAQQSTAPVVVVPPTVPPTVPVVAAWAPNAAFTAAQRSGAEPADPLGGGGGAGDSADLFTLEDGGVRLPPSLPIAE